MQSRTLIYPCVSSFLVACGMLGWWLSAQAAPLRMASDTGTFVNDSRRIAFNDGWRFRRGEALGAQQPEFVDADWLPVRLPHDWAIDGPFDPLLNPQTAALPVAGIGWYRRTFTLTALGARDYYAVEFDGAMANSQVWLNGHALGGRPYGFIGFTFDLTPFLRGAGQRNVLAVRLASEADASRWYPGAGIYRHVWLTHTGPLSVAHWGTYVTTPRITAESADIAVQTQLVDRLKGVARLRLRSSIADAQGHEVARTERTVTVQPGARNPVSMTLKLPRPRYWDIDKPYLYSLISEVRRGDQVLDRYVTDFGVRSVIMDAQRGLLLNGRHLKLKGVCLHHDLGALGAAVSVRATERQLQILKAAGVNAVRTSHNPPSPELLELADRMGFLVVDEAFDMWRIPKVANGYAKYFDEWSERDLRDMLRRDRNHPSVILWSLGNEVPEQGQADGWQVARRLNRIAHDEDPTRLTTAAFDNVEGAIGNGLAAEVDVPGFNYKPTRYTAIRRDHPNWIVYGSETASCVSSRGVYHLPLENYAKHASLQISSYDVVAPPWAYCPDVEFAAQDADSGLLGEFVWTGFDYLGEPTPFFGQDGDSSGDWPARSSYFGMVDLAGFPKDRYYLY